MMRIVNLHLVPDFRRHVWKVRVVRGDDAQRGGETKAEWLWEWWWAGDGAVRRQREGRPNF